MKSFKTFLEDAWGSHPEEQRLISEIERKLTELGKDIQVLKLRLTHGDEVLHQAFTHFERSFETLARTCHTAVKKDTANPERGEHPPKSIKD